MRLSISQKRLTGYQNALQKNGIPVEKKLLVHVDFSLEKVVKSVDNWLKNTPEIDAIISISDKSAVQIIRYLREKKVRVPGKIRVFGFGYEFVGEIVEPELSTFDTRTRLIGEEASRLIIEQIIFGNRETTRQVVTGKLIMRDSA